MGACATSSSARCAGPTSTCWATSNNAVYVDYLQEARVDMLRVHARDRRADDLAEGVVVVRHEVQYVAPLTFRFEPVRIETWVTQIRAASFTLAYEVFDETAEGRRVYLRATTVLTPYVFAHRASAPAGSGGACRARALPRGPAPGTACDAGPQRLTEGRVSRSTTTCTCGSPTSTPTATSTT